jgi:thiol-disulfide isomerase/thioredoxin
VRFGDAGILLGLGLLWGGPWPAGMPLAAASVARLKAPARSAGVGNSALASGSTQSDAPQNKTSQQNLPPSNAAQDSTTQSKTAPSNNTQRSAQQDGAGTAGTSATDTEFGAQPTSLGEIARVARANKQNQPKAHKVYDDDNFERSSLRDKPHGGGVTNTSGQDLPLAALRGKVVLLDFWATWCGPCRQALPKLRQLQAVYGSEEFAVISVSEDDDEQVWRTFTGDHQMTWRQSFDGNGAKASQYGVQALPTYILLGRDGNIVGHYEGESPGVSIVERIGPDVRKALAAKL